MLWEPAVPAGNAVLGFPSCEIGGRPGKILEEEPAVQNSHKKELAKTDQGNRRQKTDPWNRCDDEEAAGKVGFG